MASLLDSEATIAIILGASDWSKAGLGKAKSFHKSAAYLHQYLFRSRPHGLGLDPDLILSLFDDISPPSAQLARIRDFVREIVLDRRDTQKPIADILIYYIGHGTCDNGNTLHLLVRDTGHGIEAQSSISTPDLAKVLKVAAPQQRRICVFDCCFSEGAVDAFAAMGSLDETVTKIGANNLVAEPPSPQRGTMLLCSSPRGSSSIGLPNAERTLFTGALLELLQQGSDSPNSMLSFSDVKENVFEIMLCQSNGLTVPRPALHQPHQEDGDLTRLPAFPNVRAFNRLDAIEAKRREDARLAVQVLRPDEKKQNAEATRGKDEVTPTAEAKRREAEQLTANLGEQAAATSNSKAQWSPRDVPDSSIDKIKGAAVLGASFGTQSPEAGINNRPSDAISPINGPNRYRRSLILTVLLISAVTTLVFFLRAPVDQHVVTTNRPNTPTESQVAPDNRPNTPTEPQVAPDNRPNTPTEPQVAPDNGSNTGTAQRTVGDAQFKTPRSLKRLCEYYTSANDRIMAAEWCRKAAEPKQ